MKQEISLCLQLVPFNTDSIFFEERSLDSFLSYNREAQRFDYIEYNCGVSMDPNYINHLRGFRQLLSEDGIIGNLNILCDVEILTLLMISSMIRFILLCKECSY